MTLVLAAVGGHLAFVAADRQVSTLRAGKFAPDDSEFAKVGAARFYDGRAAFGFAGLAEAGRRPTVRRRSGPAHGPPPSKYGELARPFNIRRELMGAILEAGKHDPTTQGVIRALPEALKEIVRRSGAQEELSGLTVVLTGFAQPTGAEMQAFLSLVSNHEVDDNDLAPESRLRDTFEIATFALPTRAASESPLVAAFGNLRPFGASDRLKPLQHLMDDERPSEALGWKSLEMITEIGRANPGEGIGTSGTAVVVPSDPAESFTVFHEAGEVRENRLGAALVDLQDGFAIDEPRTVEYSSGGALRIQDVPRAAKNAPCPCGSGRRFKWCHGR